MPVCLLVDQSESYYFYATIAILNSFRNFRYLSLLNLLNFAYSYSKYPSKHTILS